MQVPRYIGQGRLDLVGETRPPGTVRVPTPASAGPICTSSMGPWTGGRRYRRSSATRWRGRSRPSASGVEEWHPGAPSVMPLRWPAASCHGLHVAGRTGTSATCSRLSRHRLARIDAGRGGACRRRSSFAPPSLSLGSARWPSPRRSQSTTCRRGRSAPGSTPSSSVPAPSGCSSRARPAPPGRDAVLLEAASGGSGSPADSDCRRWTIPTAERRRSGSRTDAGRCAQVAFEVSGARFGARRARRRRSEPRRPIVAVAIHPTPPPRRPLPLFWRELELIGARVYERPTSRRPSPARRTVFRLMPSSPTSARSRRSRSGVGLARARRRPPLLPRAFR